MLTYATTADATIRQPQRDYACERCCDSGHVPTDEPYTTEPCSCAAGLALRAELEASPAAHPTP